MRIKKFFRSISTMGRFNNKKVQQRSFNFSRCSEKFTLISNQWKEPLFMFFLIMIKFRNRMDRLQITIFWQIRGTRSFHGLALIY